MLLLIKKTVLAGSCMTHLVFQGKLLASEQYGAIAISLTPYAWGIVINAQSVEEAREAALGYCTSNGGRDCKVIDETRKRLAISADSKGWGAAFGYSTIEKTISEANNAAINHGASSPTAQGWGCNGDETVYINAPQSEPSAQGYGFPPSYSPQRSRS